MVAEEIVGLIGSLGFPIAISVYLLWERNKYTRELTKAVFEVKNTLEIIQGKLK